MQKQRDIRILVMLLLPAVWVMCLIVSDLSDYASAITGTDVLQPDLDINSLHIGTANNQLDPVQHEVLLALYQFEKLPVNKADPPLLMTIPGIGPEYARRIVAQRLEHGQFDSAQDLLRVKGIGPKRLEHFQQFLRFD